MSRALMTLLGRSKDKMLEIAFDDLEKATGRRAIDAEIVGDILHRAHSTIRTIGMESDVTARELYHALRVQGGALDESTSYVGLVVGGDVVSFHPADIAEDEARSSRFADRSLVHLREALAAEIIARYTEKASHPELLQPVTKQIETKKEKK